LHLLVLGLLVLSFSFSSKMPVLQNSDQNTEVINAMVMNTPPTPTKVKVTPQPQRITPKPVVTRPVPSEPIKQEAPVKPKTSVQVAPPKKQAIAISDKKEKKLEQDKIAKQLLADIKKQANQQKKVKQKELTTAFEKEMKQMMAKSIQRQMQQEQRHVAGASVQKMQGEVNKYKALILQVISQNWIIPGAVDKTLYAQLLIRVAPGGMVLDVQITKSSGDETLDRSIQTAIFKSSPLPVPPDAEAFEQFRQFVLKVKPENILGSDSWAS
jgi:colicin import membrane protein